MSKFELLKDQTLEFEGRTLFRIRALKTFKAGNGHVVNEGDLGGWVEHEHNLSQENSCWIFNEGKAYSDTFIQDDAVVTGHAVIVNSNMKNKARAHGFARLEDSDMFNNSIIGNHAIVQNRSLLTDKAQVADHAFIEKTILSGWVIIEDEASVKRSKLDGAIIIRNRVILEDIWYMGLLSLHGTAVIRSDHELFTFYDNIYFNNTIAYTPTNKRWHVGNDALTEEQFFDFIDYHIDIADAHKYFAMQVEHIKKVAALVNLKDAHLQP